MFSKVLDTEIDCTERTMLTISFSETEQNIFAIVKKIQDSGIATCMLPSETKHFIRRQLNHWSPKQAVSIGREKLMKRMIVLGTLPRVDGAFSCDFSDLCRFGRRQRPCNAKQGYGIVEDICEEIASVRFGIAICRCHEDDLRKRYRVFKLVNEGAIIHVMCYMTTSLMWLRS